MFLHDKFDLEHSHVFGATITKVMSAKSGKIVVWGTGEEARDLLYVDDLTNFVELVIRRQETRYGIFNCGYGSGISIKNLVNKIIVSSGQKMTVEHDLMKPTIKTTFILDCKKAESELGWKPRTSLDEGITKTIDWWKRNRDSIEPR